jgi:hypothetical protein
MPRTRCRPLKISTCTSARQGKVPTTDSLTHSLYLCLSLSVSVSVSVSPYPIVPCPSFPYPRLSCMQSGLCASQCACWHALQQYFATMQRGHALSLTSLALISAWQSGLSQRLASFRSDRAPSDTVSTCSWNIHT